MYVHETTLSLRHTDATGALFFANVYYLTHEALEHYLVSVGMDIGHILTTLPYHLPVVHSEADYLQPMRPGQPLRIAVRLDEVGTTSFTLGYHVTTPEGVPLATARVAHVVVGRSDGEKQAIPDELLAVLAALKD